MVIFNTEHPRANAVLRQLAQDAASLWVSPLSFGYAIENLLILNKLTDCMRFLYVSSCSKRK